jgi:hypothetical protein
MSAKDSASPETGNSKLETASPTGDLATLAKSHEHLALAARAPRCCHIRPNGLRCGSPALRRNIYCFFHHNHLNASDDNTFPPFEDGNGIQVALMYVAERLRKDAFRGGESNVPVVKQLLYALQTASINLRQTNFAPALEPTSTSLFAEDDEAGSKKPSGTEWEGDTDQQDTGEETA